VVGNDTYRVKVSIRERKTERAYCSCPAFSNNGGCKHIVAMLMAYEKHPNWFEGISDTEERLRHLPKERLIQILEMLLSSVPQARDFIEAELCDSSQHGKHYTQKIQKVIRACSMTEGSAQDLCQRLDSFFERARQFYEDKEYLPCLHICYGIVQGCLTLDEEWGSTEIFPEGFVSEVWEVYLKALKKADLSKAEMKTIEEQSKTLNHFDSYLFDQEGVYPEQAEDILRRKHGSKRTA
jgi:hypothetical protein